MVQNGSNMLDVYFGFAMLTVESILKMLFFTTFIGISVTLAVRDHKFNLLEDRYTLSLLWIGLIGNATILRFTSLQDAIFGAVAGYLLVRIMHDLQVIFRSKAGIGLGDAKLLAANCAWFDWRSIPVILVGSALFTLLFYIQRPQKPFGVGITISALILAIIRFRIFQ